MTVLKLTQIGASYAIAIARNHPFLDGDERTVYVALESFLALNGCRMPITDAEAVVMTLSMASGEIDDLAFTRWVRANVVVAV